MEEMEGNPMTRQPEENDVCREAFEKWYTQAYVYHDLTRTRGGYECPHANIAWRSFCAAWSQRVPEGMVVVPVEPTEVMIKAGIEGWREYARRNVGKDFINYGLKNGQETAKCLKYAVRFKAMIAPFVRGE